MSVVPLPPGSRLGGYEILGPLGSGGMGDVFRARDPRLQRDVAIKVLPAIFAADPDRLARFQREAQVLASLNHGGIAHVYGVVDLPPQGGSHSGVGLVMELVEGRTLDALIAPGGMPVRDALGLAVQMADALAAAHSAGIVHRDFKPGNVVVTPAGTAKVLDFGLAKSVLTDARGAAAETALATAPRTEAGMVVGTVAYMSPEQAAGRPVDVRSDVFSFGSVLFEMVTGIGAFDRDTAMSTLAAIINEPAQSAAQVNPGVPRELERVIARCQRKDPARRVQSMADLRSALEELRDDLEAGRLSGAMPVAAVRQRAGAWRYGALAIASIALIAAGAASARRWGGAAPAPVLYRLEAMTSDLGVTGHPAVSANGELLAYDSDRFDGTNFDIWVQPTGGGDPVRVTADPADDTDPAFSADGGRIAFRSEREGGGIYVVPALGGAARLLVPRGHSPRFSPDGKWLMYTTGGRGAAKDLFVMPAAGGTAQPAAPSYLVRSHGSWAADGTSIVFEGRKRGNTAQQSELYVVPVDGRGVSGPPRDTGLGPVIRAAGMVLQQTVAWDGRELLFVSSLGDGAGLWTARADGGAPAVRQVYGSTGGITGAVKASNGRLFFSGSTTRLSIASIPVTGARALATVPVELTRSVALEEWPSLSADGGQLAFRSSRYGGSVWLKDVRSGREMQMPVPSDAGSPVISPDGQQIAYTGPVSRVAVVNTRGGVPRDVCRDCGSYLSAWSPDGKYIVANSTSRDGNSHPLSIEVATGSAVAITTKGPAWFGRLSPDQRWLSFFEWPQPDLYSGGHRSFPLGIAHRRRRPSSCHGRPEFGRRDGVVRGRTDTLFRLGSGRLPLPLHRLVRSGGRQGNGHTVAAATPARYSPHHDRHPRTAGPYRRRRRPSRVLAQGCRGERLVADAARDGRRPGTIGQPAQIRGGAVVARTTRRCGSVIEGGVTVSSARMASSNLTVPSPISRIGCAIVVSAGSV